MAPKPFDVTINLLAKDPDAYDEVIYIDMSIYTCIYIYIRIYTCICTYIYMYIYVNIHIYF